LKLQAGASGIHNEDVHRKSVIGGEIWRRITLRNDVNRLFRLTRAVQFPMASWGLAGISGVV
jgi:hypothetical protein